MPHASMQLTARSARKQPAKVRTGVRGVASYSRQVHRVFICGNVRASVAPLVCNQSARSCIQWDGASRLNRIMDEGMTSAC